MTQLMATADTAFNYTTEAIGSFRQPPNSVTWTHEVITDPGPISIEMLPYRLDHVQRSPEALARLFKMIAEPEASTVAYAEKDREFWLITAQTRISPRPAWRPQIEAANTHEAIVAVLRLFGLGAVADRLSYLRRLVDDDPDEPTIKIESLRALVNFLMSERHLPDPQIGVGPDGLAQIEWRITANGILAMEFLPSGLIRFAAISAPAQHGIERMSVNGTLPKDATLDAVRPFTSRL